MTDTDDNSGTRPISVSELLARHGTAGAPSPGGRRRRRRRGTEAVTVAELTGEIPIVTDEPPESADFVPSTNGTAHSEVVDRDLVEDRQPAEPAMPEPDLFEDSDHDDYSQPFSESQAFSESQPYSESQPFSEPYSEDYSEPYPGPYPDSYPEPNSRDYSAPKPKAGPKAAAKGAYDTAEEMRPDPVAVDEADVTLAEPAEVQDSDLATFFARSEEPLFGSLDTDEGFLREDAHYAPAADEFGRAPDDLASLDELGRPSTVEELTGREKRTTRPKGPSSVQKVLRGLLIVGQSILAVAFGAGLFIGFGELWEWNSIVALVLSVLVILGLVVAVRLVRRTEDTASTLIAVAVGALVTLGPLALMQSF